MAAAPLILLAAGTAISAAGTIASGIQQNKMAKFEASQMERQARAETAQGSRVGAEESRQRRLALSRARAVGAAPGAGRAARIEGEIEKEGRYRELTAVWEGGERAAGRMAQASARRAEGKAARMAGFVRGAGTLASGFGSALNSPSGQSLLAKYG